MEAALPSPDSWAGAPLESVNAPWAVPLVPLCSPRGGAARQHDIGPWWQALGTHTVPHFWALTGLETLELSGMDGQDRAGSGPDSVCS